MPDGDKPGYSRQDRDRLTLCHAQRHVRATALLRDRPGDSALRVIGRKPPCPMPAPSPRRSPRSRTCPKGVRLTLNGTTGYACRGVLLSRLPVWGAGYGPQALKADRGTGRRLEPAGGRPDIRPLDSHVGAGCRGGRRTGPRRHHRVRGRARPTWARTSPTSATRCAGSSAAWWATTWPISLTRDGYSSQVPKALDGLRERAPQGLRLQPPRQSPHNPWVDFVSDEIVDRFCLVGSAADHVRPPHGAVIARCPTSSPCT